MRLFAALPVEGAAADAIARVTEDLPPIGRAVPEGNWHITLGFAQDVPDVAAEDWAEGIAGITPRPFAWSVLGFGCFGGDAPRQVHALVDPDAALLDAARQVRRVARAAGIDLPHRRFVPHVTLMRLRGAPPDRRLADWLARRAVEPLGPFAAPPVTLYLSELRPDGPRYTPVVSSG